MEFLRKYRQGVQHEHGWQVELHCSQCGHSAVPNYKGWIPNNSVAFGNQATIFAQLFCTNCGKNLASEAAARLAAMFVGVAMPRANRRLLLKFVVTLLAVPLALLAVVFAGVQWQWWSGEAYAAVALSCVAIGPLTMWFNFRVASLRSRCSCGKPRYLFMGLLGRSYCYRCGTCANLLRLRD